MCGILGVVDLESRIEIDLADFKCALDLLKHRGPDDSGVYKGNGYIFGHRRLSIIDLDVHAKQPMNSSCGRYVIIFNGEIFNYKEIREKLICRGYIFKTESDTEVLLYSYMEYGVNCLNELNGMFSFAIYDNSTAECVIARDRLGVKPLYYTRSNGNIVFSSEIKSILHIDKNKRSMNIDAVSSYMSFRYPILNDSFFEGINVLEPAHFMKIYRGRVDVKQYWDLSSKISDQNDDKGEDYYIKTLKDILESSVRYKMISDVPVGAYLSGGVDSSIITALMSKQSMSPVDTFTIGFSGQDNEFGYANDVSNLFSTSHHEVTMKAEAYLSSINNIIAFKDAPLSVPNEVSLYHLSRKLSKYITVVLSGEGADEIFGGYGRIFRSPLDYYKMNDLNNFGLSSIDDNRLSDALYRKYSTIKFDSEVDHFLSIYSYTSLREKKELFSNDVGLDYIEEKFKLKFNSIFNEVDSDYYNRIMYAFEKVHLQGLLARLDSATMANSIEGRVPFTDHRLVEFAFTVPIKYKLKWMQDDSIDMTHHLTSDMISEVHDIPKYILKKSYEGVLPNEILYRKKVGFPVPLGGQLFTGLRECARNVLLDDAAVSRGLYNIDNIKKWIEVDSENVDHGLAMKVWMLINLELFNRMYFDS